MKLNAFLICTGLGLVAAGLYRMGMIKIDRKFMVDILPLLGIAIALCIANFWIGGQGLANKGMEHSAKMIVSFAPMMTVMFLMMGQAVAMMNLFQPTVIAYLAGKWAAFGSLLAAYVVPGGLTSMPIIKILWDKGANPIPLVMFTLNSSLVGWQVALIRQPMLGWRITLINYCVGTVVAVTITAIGQLCMSSLG